MVGLPGVEGLNSFPALPVRRIRMATALRGAPPAECAVLAAAAAVAWATATYPSSLPVWAPWDFSWAAFLGAGFAALWFVRGYFRIPAAERISAWRCLWFFAGLAGLYAVLLTRFEYVAQHAFFLNRVQHLTMHHLCPFLIALSWPGETIAPGMPSWLRHGIRAIGASRPLRMLQRPVPAFLLFEGLLMLWLVPPVTFRAMIDPHLYAIMNASMVIDGLLFWFLVLDPRAAPAASVSFFIRLCLDFIVIFPQIAVGTLIGAVHRDLYPSFALCGRIYPAIGPLLDQEIGGLILWVPSGMMSAIGAVLIMSRMFAHEDRAGRLDSLEGVL